jgi:trimethylguanosine synthase
MSTTEKTPPEGVHHYDSADEVPFEITKYWHQRFEIFSKYDEGIWMTDDAWFGATPEPVANKVAEHIAAAPKSKTVLVDAFAGAGGNTIAFALSGRWKQIFAIEKDPKALACAKHNAEVYGVAKKIWWIEEDVFKVFAKQLKAVKKSAVVFASPPWGGTSTDSENKQMASANRSQGPSYTDYEVYDLSVMQPYPLEQLYSTFSTLSNEVVLYLPRTSDLRQLAKQAKDDQEVKVTHYCMHGASKALCAYFGDFAVD